MTAGQFGEVNLDLLADYLGGALAGTPEEVAVVRLITNDPSWGRAHAALAPAVGEIRASLADWALRPEPMPSDVVDRLDTALAGAGPLIVEADGSTPTAPVLPDRSRRLTVVPGESFDGAAKPARRRWSRWAGRVAVAAAVVAFAGFAASQLVNGGSARDSAGTAVSGESAGAPAAGPGAPTQAFAELSAGRLLATGTDYARPTLAGALTSLGPRANAAGKNARDNSAAAAPDPASGPTARGLERLVGRVARAACLDAVAAAHGRGPVVVDLVDYASFEGSPAVVVSFVDRAGERWAWVAGPECGQPQSGADTRYRTRVG